MAVDDAAWDRLCKLTQCGSACDPGPSGLKLFATERKLAKADRIAMRAEANQRFAKRGKWV